MKVLSANTLGSYTTDTVADRDGTVVGVTVSTYLAAKDSMTQIIGVENFGNNLDIFAGETITVVAGTNSLSRLNLSTREAIVDATGSAIIWSATVTEDVTLSGTGTGNITVTGPAIFEANGQYNTATQAIAAGDVVSLKGAVSTLIQPALFWQKQAFTLATVPIKRLHSTDTIATTEDGMQMRVSKGSNFLENEQLVRIDFRPAYGVLNPFFAGQGFGLT
jgi:hypothetical protein